MDVLYAKTYKEYNIFQNIIFSTMLVVNPHPTNVRNDKLVRIEVKKLLKFNSP